MDATVIRRLMAVGDIAFLRDYNKPSMRASRRNANRRVRPGNFGASMRAPRNR